MTEEELKITLTELLALSGETEWVEFKHAKDSFHFDDLGEYFSALSNEANLKNQQNGWLVFGVNNKREIVGTNFRRDIGKLHSLKHEISQHTNSNITFIEIRTLNLPEGRVILFQIPPAPLGIPVTWKRISYGRDGESLVPLSIQEIEIIRSQKKTDWSGEVCPGATLNDLDKDAIQKARIEYKKKNQKLADDVDKWNDETFLNKIKAAVQGQVTRAAIIILGKPESVHLISPSVAKMSWILKNEQNLEIDYEHFDPPFILNSEAILKKIRNLKYRYLPDNTLFPEEILKYEPWVIREALHNCIAHQDYFLNSRIIIVEKDDELIFNNAGSFIPQSIETVITQDAPQRYYRNQLLAELMVNVNMIDTIGSGIKKMFIKQRERFFPLPTYELDIPDEVTVKIYGKVLDENYSRVLSANDSLGLQTVMLLDSVQKKKIISKDAYKLLKQKRLVEGRFPNIFVSYSVTYYSGDRAKYIRNRAFDKKYYKDLIIEYISKYGKATRKELHDLLLTKISDVLNEKQKKAKVKNLLFEMAHKDKTIIKTGKTKASEWKLK
jgi:ATP-dependent DNA helicase RecG